MVIRFRRKLLQNVYSSKQNSFFFTNEFLSGKLKPSMMSKCVVQNLDPYVPYMKQVVFF